MQRQKRLKPSAMSGRPLVECIVVSRFQGFEAKVLGSLCQTKEKKRVLAYSPGSTEFVELSIDGEAVLDALADAGSYGNLIETLDNPSGPERERLDTFVHELHKLGLLFIPSSALPSSARQANLTETK